MLGGCLCNPHSQSESGRSSRCWDCLPLSWAPSMGSRYSLPFREAPTTHKILQEQGRPNSQGHGAAPGAEFSCVETCHMSILVQTGSSFQRKLTFCLACFLIKQNSQSSLRAKAGSLGGLFWHGFAWGSRATHQRSRKNTGRRIASLAKTQHDVGCLAFDSSKQTQANHSNMDLRHSLHLNFLVAHVGTFRNVLDMPNWALAFWRPLKKTVCRIRSVVQSRLFMTLWVFLFHFQSQKIKGPLELSLSRNPATTRTEGCCGRCRASRCAAGCGCGTRCWARVAGRRTQRREGAEKAGVVVSAIGRGVDSQFFSTIVLFKNRIRFPKVLGGLYAKKAAWKEWGRYPQRFGFLFLEQKRSWAPLIQKDVQNSGRVNEYERLPQLP